MSTKTLVTNKKYVRQFLANVLFDFYILNNYSNFTLPSRLNSNGAVSLFFKK